MHGGLSILIADEPHCAQETTLMIRRWGHQAEQAHDGLAAVDEARRTKPDLMFVGLSLPGLNGFGVAQEVFRTPELNQVKVAALLANKQEVPWRELKKAGFCERLVKPLEPLELLAAIVKIRDALGKLQQTAKTAQGAAARSRGLVESVKRDLARQAPLNASSRQPLDRPSAADEACSKPNGLLAALIDSRRLERTQLAVAMKVLADGDAALTAAESHEFAQLQRRYLAPVCKLCHYRIPQEEAADSWNNGGYCRMCFEAMR